MFTRMFQIFCSLATKMYQIFGVLSETIFFFSSTPFFQNFGAPFHLEDLGNGLIGLVEGPALNSVVMVRHDSDTCQLLVTYYYLNRSNALDSSQIRYPNDISVDLN